MQRSILFLLCLISLVVSVSGYGLYVDCTKQVIAGVPITCSVDSDLPTGTTFYVELYSPSIQPISRQQVTTGDNKTIQYRSYFDTTGLASGNYSVNVRLKLDGTIFRNDSRFGNPVIITSPQTLRTTIPATNTPVVSTTITTSSSPPITLMTTASNPIPTTSLTLTAPPSTVQTTTVPTTLISASPTKSVNQLLEEQNKKIDEQNRLITEQNKKMESQNDLLSQILSKIKSIFGWN